MQKFLSLLATFLCALVIGANGQSISVDVSGVDSYVESYQTGLMNHQAFLDFTIEFGSIEPADINSFSFTAEFSHNASGVVDFYIDGNEAVDAFQTCLGADVVTITELASSANSKTYQYTASFTNGSIPYINSVLCPILATVVKTVIITPLDGDDTDYDCGVGDTETVDIGIEFANASVYDSNNIHLMSTSDYSGSHELPTCGHPQLEHEEYSLHFERAYDGNDIILDIYIRYNDQEIISGYKFLNGNIRFELESATASNLSLLSSGAASATLTGSTGSLISYNFNGIIPFANNTNHHLGSVKFTPTGSVNDCVLAIFKSGSVFPATVILNETSTALTGVDYRPAKFCFDQASESIIFDDTSDFRGGGGKGKLANSGITAYQLNRSGMLAVQANLNDISNSNIVTLMITDIKGGIVYRQELGSKDFDQFERFIQLPVVSPGLYFVRLFSQEEQLSTKIWLD